MPLLKTFLQSNGTPACPSVIRRITRTAGYSWREVRIVLTSADPMYSYKLDRIHSILSNLQPDEAFLDRRIRSLRDKDTWWVKTCHSCGTTYCPSMAENARLSNSNCCARFVFESDYAFLQAKKNADEMMKMMDILVIKYANRRKISLSWDVASWYIAKRLTRQIDEHNAKRGVIIETAPLPTGAQFLNVIESVFSGMSRAIIHNSDYRSIHDATVAIDRYFGERNTWFLAHPQRAGKKLWAKERKAAVFSDSSNFKDPRYR